MAVPTASEINKRITTPDVMPIIALISSGCVVCVVGFMKIFLIQNLWRKPIVEMS